MSAHGQKESCMDLQKAGAALLLGSAGFRDVTERAETPAGRRSRAVVHPNSADTPLNHLRKGSRPFSHWPYSLSQG